MSKIICFLIIIFVTTSCSFNKNSKFWTNSQNILEENKSNFKDVYVEEEALENELNPNLKIKLVGTKTNNSKYRNYYNNDGRFDYDGTLKKLSRYKSSYLFFIKSSKTNVYSKSNR